MTIKINMIKKIPPYKIDIGDTIILRGIREFSNDQEHCYIDQNKIDLRGHRLLVTDVEYSDENDDFYLTVRCNNCNGNVCNARWFEGRSPHVLYFGDEDINNIYVTVFNDNTKTYELYEEMLK
jgi:hypothetical protein